MTQAVNVPGVGTLNFPDGMSQQDMAAAIQKNFPQIHNQTKEDTTSELATQGERLAGGAGGVVDALSKGLSSIPAGVAGAAGALKGLVTPGDDAGETAENWMNNTADFLNKPRVTIGTPLAQQAQGYQEGNQGAQQGLSAVAQVPGALAEKGTDALVKTLGAMQPQSPQYQAALAKANAGMQGAANVGANILPMIAGPRGVSGPVKVPEMTPFKLANSAGYSIMPSEAAIKGGSAPMGKIIEGLAGSAKTGVDATVKNQAVTNRLAAQDLGAPKGALLTPETLDALRKPHNAVYNEVAKLSDLSYKGPRGQPIQVGKIKTDNQYFHDLNDIGRTPGNSFPDAKTPGIDDLKHQYAVKDFNSADAVLQIRTLRKNAQANYKAAGANVAADAPMLAEKAEAQMSIANALEWQLDRAATNLPGTLSDPTLIPRWKAARQSLAKINTVDNAIKAGTTDVSAPALAKQLNKGAPLSGNLKTIADTANAFPISVRDITAVRNKVPINALEGLMGGASIPAAMLLHEPHLAAAGIAGMVARPTARAGLLSSPIQKGMLPSQPMNPLLRSLIDPAVLQALQTGNKQ